MNKKFLTGVGIGLLSITTLEVYNKVINQYAKKYSFNRSDGYYYTWKEGAIHYTVKGKGSPVILIHDLNPLSSEYEWNKIIDNLSEKHTVYTLDLLGCGMSDKPDIIYINYTFVQLIKDFIKDIVKNKCDIITSNDASSIAIMTQKIYNLFNNIILINPAPIDSNIMNTTKYDLLVKRLIYLPVIGTTIYNHKISKHRITSILNTYLYNTNNIDKLSEVYYESSHINNSDGRYLYSCKRCNYVSTDVESALKNMKNIHIIRGIGINKNDTYEYEKINPTITTTSINNSNVLPHLENPNDTIKEINNII